MFIHTSLGVIARICRSEYMHPRGHCELQVAATAGRGRFRGGMGAADEGLMAAASRR